MTYTDIVNKIANFNKIRGWDPIPEDLAKSISIEAAELLEHFQWDASEKNIKNKNWQEISYELVDIFWYLITFCRKSNIDLLKATLEKIRILEKKYPKKYFNGKDRPDAYYQLKSEYRQKKKT